MKAIKFKVFGVVILFGIIGIMSVVIINFNSNDYETKTFNGLPVNISSAFF